MPSTRRAAILLGAALCLAAAPAARPAAAQDAEEFVNFAFASRLGSGVYDVGGRTIQIYRIGITTALYHENDARKWRLELSTPLTIGLFDFEPRDILTEGVPTHFDSYSLTPGLRFTWPMSERWRIMPFLNAGPVHEGATDSTSWVYTIGVRSEAHLRQGDHLEWIVRDEFVWSGMAESGVTLADEFGEFHNGAEAWFPLNATIRGKQLKMAPFVVAYYYWDGGEFLNDPGVEADPYGLQFEVGVLFVTEPQLTVFKLGIPEIGLSYRWGDGFESIRLVLGHSF
jgi:hypothetical protein